MRVRALIENMRWSGRWPDPDAQDFTPAFLGKLFQAGAMNEVIGLVDFENGVQMDLTGLADNIPKFEFKVFSFFVSAC